MQFRIAKCEDGNHYIEANAGNEWSRDMFMNAAFATKKAAEEHFEKVYKTPPVEQPNPPEPVKTYPLGD